MTVLTARNGFDALEVVAAEPPDLILLDVMMPGMDGWEVLQRLRTHPQTEALPIIVCSIFHDPELAYSLGATLVLPKPISQVKLLEALGEIGVM